MRLFSDITEGKSKSAVRETFTIVREGLSIAVPFVGLPNCMPACFGLINKLQALGVEDVTAPRRYKQIPKVVYNFLHRDRPHG